MSKSQALKYEILVDLNLIIDSWSGVLSVDDIVFHKLEQAKDLNWRPDYATLSDLRDAELPLHPSEIDKLIGYTKTDKRCSVKRKTAHLTNSPNQVAFDIMLNNSKPKSSELQLAVFSTITSSLFWLGYSDTHLEKVEQVLMKLKMKGK